MFDNNGDILPLPDTKSHVDLPPILMPEALSIISIPTLLFSKLKTILPCLASPELSLQLLIIPGEASVLEASVVSIPLLRYVSAVIISHTHRELGKSVITITKH